VLRRNFLGIATALLICPSLLGSEKAFKRGIIRLKCESGREGEIAYFNTESGLVTNRPTFYLVGTFQTSVNSDGFAEILLTHHNRVILENSLDTAPNMR
jgi:hypothetical protein